MNYERQSAAERRAQIIAAATQLAKLHGYQNVTREQIAEVVGYGSRSSINVHFASMHLLRDTLMAEAIDNRDLTIIAQGLVADDPIAVAAPQGLKRKAAMTLA